MPHTPGPWRVFPWNNGQFAVEQDCHDEEGVADTIYSQDDARLIAAAPDLLAALCKLCMVAEEFKSKDPQACLWANELLLVARATIRKATATECSHNWLSGYCDLCGAVKPI